MIEICIAGIQAGASVIGAEGFVWGIYEGLNLV